MPVKLIPKKTETVKIDGAEFEITYITPAALSKIYNRHSERGTFDAMSVTTDVLKSHVKNWSGVEDEDGNPVEFSAELIEYLPFETQSKLFGEITKHAGSSGEVEKN